MKTRINQFRRSVVLCFIAVLWFQKGTAQLTVTGNNPVYVGEEYEYVLSSGNNIGEINWSVTAGEGVLTPTANPYRVMVRFDVAGTTLVSVTARNYDAPFTSYITGSLNVTVQVPPTPDNPTYLSNECGSAVIRSDLNGGPPAGIRWYWQGKNATSTSTALGWASTFPINQGNGTYYLRARHTSSGAWSTEASSINVTINQFTSGGSIEVQGGNNEICTGGDPPILQNDVFPDGAGSKTYLWQYANSSGGPWINTTGSQSYYDPPAGLTSDRWYRRQVTSCGGQIKYSNVLMIDVNPPDPPTGSSTAEGCEYGNMTVSLTPGNGGNTTRWYTTATGGSHIDQGSLSLTEVTIGSVYYASTYNTSAGCESTTRKQVTIVQASAANCEIPDSGSQSTFISGDTNMVVGDQRTYTMTPPTSLGEIVWSVPGNKGSVVSTSANGYSATIQYNAPGQFDIGVSGRDLNSQDTNYVSSSLEVYIAGPEAPNITLSSNTSCGEAYVYYNGSAPNGFVWYWQGKNANGTLQNLGSGDTFTVNEGTGTYYLRAYHTASQLWSPAVSETVTEITAFSGGSIRFQTGGTSQICHGANRPILSNDVLPPGRITADTSFQWEQAGSASGPWTPISGATNGFSLSNTQVLTADTWYRRAATSCGGEVQYSNVLMVDVMDSLQTPQGATTHEVCPQGTVDIDLTVTSGHVLRWYVSQTATTHLEEGILTLTGASAGGSYFASSYNTTSGCESGRVEISIVTAPLTNCGNTGGPDLGVDPDINLTISGNNYVYTREYQNSLDTPLSFFTANDDVIQQITYFDGMGRPIQQIGMDHSPQKQDIVTHMEYDDYGRTLKEYLPYATAQGTIGSLKTGMAASIDTWYNIPKYENTLNPFSEKEFEDSPLDRVYKQAAPGNDWALGNGNEIELAYDTNTASDDVRQFEVSLSASGNTYVPTLVEDGTDLEYTAGELLKNTTRDENHGSSDGDDHTTVEFINKQGQVVLKRTFNNGQRHDTYYVYGDHGNLSFVLPPLMDASTTAIGTLITKLPDLAYRYVYDQRNRLVEKQLPGKEKEYIVYNKADQPIMTQDSIQRVTGEWLFTKYDAFGRVAYTGKATDTRERDLIQTEVDALTGTTWEAKSTAFTMDGITVGYANNAYPTTTVVEILTVNYYDDYSFDFSPSTNGVTAFTVSSTTNTQGLATGSRVKVLDTNPAEWIGTTTYYDEKARPIYTHSNNAYLGTVDVVESKLDFVGRVLQSRSAHTRNGTTLVTLDNFEYDHVGRLLKQTQCIGDQGLGYSCSSSSAQNELLLQNSTVTTDQQALKSITLSAVITVSGTATLSIVGNGGQEELIVYNSYDELGQLQAKKVGGTPGTDYATTAGLQTVDLAYNVRGWLEAINDANTTDSNLSLDADDLWGFKIKYNDIADAGKKLYNGNISQTLWDSKSTNSTGNPVSNSYTYAYDALNRITEAVDNTTNYSLSAVAYDKNGNITNLQRQGHTNAGASTFGAMDNLGYSYTGNQLQAVDDTANATYGFVDGAEQGVEYTYDANGNMKTDANKGITAISYNHLNLPTSISINGAGGNGAISYIYDATGTKLQKTVGSSVTDYAANHVYQDGSLQFFNHAEGYVTPDGGSGYDYIYQYKDHLGNVRISYMDNNGTTEIVEENNHYPFGLKQKGYNEGVSPLGNSVAKKWKYNGAEFEEGLGVDIYEMPLRQYDPAIARWTSIDPVTHHSMSTYTAFDNNPAIWADPSGANSIYNWSTGQYVINGQTVSQDEAVQYAKNGGNADGKNNNNQDPPKFLVYNMTIIPGRMGISHGGDFKQLVGLGFDGQFALEHLEGQEMKISEALGNSEEFMNNVAKGLGLSKRTVKKMLNKLLKKRGGSFDVGGKSFTMLDVVQSAYNINEKGLEGVPLVGSVFATDKNEIDALIAVSNAWDDVLAGPERIQGMTEMANVVLIFTNENLQNKTEIDSKEMQNTPNKVNHEKSYIYYGTQHGNTIHLFGRYNNPNQQ